VLFRSGLPRPRPALAVGGFAGHPAWAASLPGLLDRHRADAGVVSAHRYALATCGGAPEPGALRERLLSPGGRAPVERLRAHVALADRHRLPLHVAELNSAPCGGAPGISDAFAAALWMTDSLFILMRSGADRVDVHTWDGAVYAIFERRGAAVRPRPLFFGMLAFARAAPPGSRLVPSRLDDGGRLRSWATVDRAGTVRVALINPVEGRSAGVEVAVARGRPCATLRLTHAPSTAARSGVVDGPPRRRCARGGAIALRLPAPSVAVLEIPPPPPRAPGGSRP
jgi:hypothetical protein